MRTVRRACMCLKRCSLLGKAPAVLWPTAIDFGYDKKIEQAQSDQHGNSVLVSRNTIDKANVVDSRAFGTPLVLSSAVHRLGKLDS